MGYNTQEEEAGRSELFKGQPGLCRDPVSKTEKDLKCHKTKSQ